MHQVLFQQRGNAVGQLISPPAPGASSSLSKIELGKYSAPPPPGWTARLRAWVFHHAHHPLTAGLFAHFDNAVIAGFFAGDGFHPSTEAPVAW